MYRQGCRWREDENRLSNNKRCNKKSWGGEREYIICPYGDLGALTKRILNDSYGPLCNHERIESIGAFCSFANGANIGNGVIAAGAVITKDVPDYAVVAGVPARIIRYRYSKQQIDALNKIAWWDWSDEKIRENYDDFFLDVDLFTKKHLNQ